MLILAINTATSRNEIALLDDNEILFEKSWLSNKDEAEKLLPAIKTAFKKTKTQIKNLKKIFVVTGPGPFTGLRIGISVANALAFTQQIPVLSCSTNEYLRVENASTGNFGATVVILLKSRLKAAKQAYPVYLKKPNITKSKKPVFSSAF